MEHPGDCGRRTDRPQGEHDRRSDDASHDQDQHARGQRDRGCEQCDQPECHDPSGDRRIACETHRHDRQPYVRCDSGPRLGPSARTLQRGSTGRRWLAQFWNTLGTTLRVCLKAGCTKQHSRAVVRATQTRVSKTAQPPSLRSRQSCGDSTVPRQRRERVRRRDLREAPARVAVRRPAQRLRGGTRGGHGRPGGANAAFRGVGLTHTDRRGVRHRALPLLAEAGACRLPCRQVDPAGPATG